MGGKNYKRPEEILGVMDMFIILIILIMMMVLQVYTYMKPSKLYTLKMFSLLYLNHTSIKLLKIRLQLQLTL